MHPEVEDQHARVVPPGPRRKPVDGEQGAGGHLDAQLLAYLAHDPVPGRLAGLDDASRQVPVGLVDQLAQHHPAGGVADQALGDHPLGRQSRVEHRPEAVRGLRTGVVGEPAQQHRVAAPAVERLASAHQALAAKARPRCHPQRPGVVRVHVGLDPRDAEVLERVRHQHPHGAYGGATATVVGVERPGQEAVALVVAPDLDRARDPAVALDREADDPAVVGVGSAPVVDRLLHPLGRRDDPREVEPVRHLVVVLQASDLDVVIAPRAQHDRIGALAVAQRRLVRYRLGHPSCRSQTVPSGGSVSVAEAGRPCQGDFAASTTPRLPTPDPR